MEQQPRWAEMCARILQQCQFLKGGRDNLAAHLQVPKHELTLWLTGKSGPPRSVFEKAMEIILEEHDRRAKVADSMPTGRRRSDQTASGRA